MANNIVELQLVNSLPAQVALLGDYVANVASRGDKIDTRDIIAFYHGTESTMKNYPILMSGGGEHVIKFHHFQLAEHDERERRAQSMTVLGYYLLNRMSEIPESFRVDRQIKDHYCVVQAEAFAACVLLPKMKFLHYSLIRKFEDEQLCDHFNVPRRLIASRLACLNAEMTSSDPADDLTAAIALGGRAPNDKYLYAGIDGHQYVDA
jgi:hypothetical protein